MGPAMKSSWKAAVGFFILGIIVSGFVLYHHLWAEPQPAREKQAAKEAPADPPNEPSNFNKLLLKAAQSYKTYRRVEDKPNSAPTDCRAPRDPLFASKSSDQGTHGQKLYY